MVVPPLNGGADCPTLSVVTMCPKSLECQHNDVRAMSYKYQVGAWGPCRNDQASEGRGTGIQLRDVLCVDVQGRAIDESLCHKFLGIIQLILLIFNRHGFAELSFDLPKKNTSPITIKHV